MRRFAIDYTQHFDRLAHAFAGNPNTKDDWAAAIGRAQLFPRDRERLHALLAAQAGRYASPPAARANIDRLRDPRTVAIVTGQQAGVAGGPLYTLLKALTAIRLARDVEARHGVPTVPVFWIDAEDHDWPEVRSVAVLDQELALRTITLPDLEGAGDTPVGRLVLDEHAAAAVASLGDVLSPTGFTADLLQGLAEAYRPGRTMAEAFGHWLSQVLGTRGLVLYDASDVAAKPLAAEVFAREIAEPGTTVSLATRAGEALRAQGYHAQVTTHPDGLALFYLDGGRHAMRFDAEGIRVDTRTVAPAAMADEARRHPERFSPNVLLRPLVQDTIFPTICYVAGPNELAYLGQLRDVYRHFGVPMPLVHGRQSATVLDAAALRFLARYGLPLEALQPQDEAGLNKLLEANLPAAVEDALQEAARAITEQMQRVMAAVPAIDPTLEGAARSTLGKMEHDWRTLHTKVIHAAKRRDETLRRQFMRARALAFPGGHPQEREVAFVFFLNRYGPAFVDLLEADLPLDPGQHWVVSI